MRIAVAACLCFGTVSAQEQLRVRPAEVQQEDVVAALGALGVDVLRFDFSDFTRENYDVAVYLDEADSDGEWGELRFDFENGAAEIVRLADWDTTTSNIFAKRRYGLCRAYRKQDC